MKAKPATGKVLRWAGWRPVIAAVGLFSSPTMRLEAHEPPAGEVYPAVTVRDGKFLVSFYERDQVAHWERVIRVDGTVEIDRRPQGEERPLGPLPVHTVNSVCRQAGIDPEKEWIDYSGNAEIDGGLVAQFTAQPKNPADPCGPFSFRKLNLKTGQTEAEAVIGTPGRIYWSAVASNIIVVEGEVMLAWIWETNVKMANDTRESDTALVLSRWKPGPNPVRHYAIRKTHGANAALSIGAIDGQVLVTCTNGERSAWSW